MLEIILQLIRFICIPCLLYAIKACTVNKNHEVIGIWNLH